MRVSATTAGRCCDKILELNDSKQYRQKCHVVTVHENFSNGKVVAAKQGYGYYAIQHVEFLEDFREQNIWEFPSTTTYRVIIRVDMTRIPYAR